MYRNSSRPIRSPITATTHPTPNDNPYFVGTFWCPVHLKDMYHHVIFEQRNDIAAPHIRIVCVSCCIDFSNATTDHQPKVRTIYLHSTNANSTALFAAHSIRLA